MKLPSMEQVLRDAVSTLRRFPFVLACAAIGTAAAITLIDLEEAAHGRDLFRVLYAALPGVPLLLALALLAEREAMGRAKAALLQGGGVLLLAAYAFSLPENLPCAPQLHHMRLAVLAAAMHLLVAVLPHLRRGGTDAFWQYNITLLLRALATALFTGVLFAGLAVALAAVDTLFGLDIAGKRYGELGVLLLGMFTTWFFLAGVPRDLGAPEAVYPKGLRVFAQNFLFPLSVVYLLILYAYMAKLLIQWDWPRGWVGELVLGFAVTGNLALLLLHPLRQASAASWVARASRWFHVVMIPLVVMLFLALFRRIGEYGVTEQRFLALALGAWCAAMIVYALLRRGGSIKAVPLSLFLLAAVFSYGPWSAFTVSRTSQTARLESILRRDGLLQDGRVRRATAQVSDRDAQEISAVFTYLGVGHGYAHIESWFTESLRTTESGACGGFKAPADVVKLLGVEYIATWARADAEEVTFDMAEDAALDVRGWEEKLPAKIFNPGVWSHDLATARIRLRASGNLSRLTVGVLENGVVGDSATADMRAFARRLSRRDLWKNTSAMPPDSMTIDIHGARFDARVCVHAITVRRTAGQYEPLYYHVTVLLRRGDAPAASPVP